MKRINIMDNVKKSKGRKFHLFPALIISFLGILTYFYITDKELALQALKSTLSFKSRGVIYESFDIYLDSVDAVYSQKIKEDLGSIKYEDRERFTFVEKKEKADFVIQYGIGQDSIYSEYLLPVGHMYWITDSVSSNDISEGGYKIIMEEEEYNKYTSLIDSNYEGIEIEKVSNLEDELINEECNCIGLIKPEDLKKEYKLLKYDGKYYLDTFDGGLEISLALKNQSDDFDTDFVKNIVEGNLQFSDEQFNEATIAKVNMTGVTAMGRRVIQAINSRGDYEYPAKRIASFLSDADLTHTSNEVSFVPGCSTYSGLRFCSRPEAIASLKAIGADLIELTGNHNNDFGSQYSTQSIELYKEEGMDYFGGGLNSEDAAKPYITQIDGTTIGFLGYNYYDAIVAGGTNALAGDNKAGANAYSESKMKEDIESLRDEVDIIIVDFQFQECYSYPSGDVIYPVCYKPINNQASTFRKAIDYGADIVVGTQAHQPQTYELYEDGVIFYGLGNLFFDQSMWIGTRQGIVLTHYFKAGQLIQTKITPTIYDSTLQVEVANQEDGQLLLELLSTARRSL
jgi:poly-gamma-glutamate capsule biosynthesis protein CapA/YwtB (metallophosphatase superfamily)